MRSLSSGAFPFPELAILLLTGGRSCSETPHDWRGARGVEMLTPVELLVRLG